MKLSSLFFLSTVLIGTSGSRRGLKANKIDICHLDEDSGTWETISVSTNGNALNAHKNHGDFVCGENSLECNSSLGCVCVDGYEFNGEDGCVDINECTTGTDNCNDNAECSNTIGSFECECNNGYEGDGVNCVDIDECTDGLDNCHTEATCTNSPGSFECECSEGYEGDGMTCEDVDECTVGTDNCHDNADCSNTLGSFTCMCDDGFTGDGLVCDDIDECTDGLHNCGTNAECSNTEGSFTCMCDDGFTGDGMTCEDVDECTIGSDNCHDNAVCSNTEGSFTCMCDDGFTGDGMTCEDVDECTIGSDNCHDNADCSNTPGSFKCACDAGFDGDGVNCVDIDYCLDDPCGEYSTCTDGIDTYSCECETGYAGDGVTCEPTCGLVACTLGFLEHVTLETICDSGSCQTQCCNMNERCSEAYLVSYGELGMCSGIDSEKYNEIDDFICSSTECTVDECCNEPTCGSSRCSLINKEFTAGFTPTSTCGSIGDSSLCDEQCCKLIGDGVEHNGLVWYNYGDKINKSCNDVCEDHGLVTANDEEWFNAQNTNAKCEALMAKFRLPNYRFQETYNFYFTYWNFDGCVAVNNYYSIYGDPVLPMLHCSMDSTCTGRSKTDIISGYSPGAGGYNICPCVPVP
jgi:hypothetical protein